MTIRYPGTFGECIWVVLDHFRAKNGRFPLFQSNFKVFGARFLALKDFKHRLDTLSKCFSKFRNVVQNTLEYTLVYSSTVSEAISSFNLIFPVLQESDHLARQLCLTTKQSRRFLESRTKRNFKKQFKVNLLSE